MRRLLRPAGSTVAGLLIVGTAVLLARQQVPVPAGYPTNGQPPVVKIVYPGAEPRRPIRYAIARGRTEPLTMDMAMELAMGLGGASVPSMILPTMRMAADVAVTDVTPSGDATYTVALTASAGRRPCIAREPARLGKRHDDDSFRFARADEPGELEFVSGY